MIQVSRNGQDLDPQPLRENLPDEPGIYLFKDHDDRVVYVGKAKNIKKRVLSYFRPPSDLTPKTNLMMKKAQEVDFIITATENEAFILESSLIKKHLPRYNIILRDDKQYPCLRLSIKETYPRLSIVRKIKKDGALYFGPFSSAHSVRNTLKLIDRIFRLRKCKGNQLPKRIRPCLNGQLGRCLGPCANDIPEAEYRAIVKHVKLFLKGRNPALLKQLREDMTSASAQLHFEDAARIRDMIKAVERITERQNVVSIKMEDLDVIGLARKDNSFQLVILFIRGGYLLGGRDYHFWEKSQTSSEDIMEAFIKQYYHKEIFIPQKILISEAIEDIVSIKGWLSELAGKGVIIHHPLKGDKYHMVQMAVSNAENLILKSKEPQEEDLAAMAMSVLGLKKAPHIIEGLDISNLQGDMAVGAVVSFRNGLPFKSRYRNYKIKNVDNIDDYGMMSELVQRRLSSGNEPPDLFLIDGGKGHLMAVKRALDRFTHEKIPDVIAIAKADKKRLDQADKIYIIDRKNPLRLKKDHPLLFYFMRIRDEAHRRAIGYHRKLRTKHMDVSILDQVPGIGPKRKKDLLKRFGDMDGVLNAGLEGLISMPGISQPLAQRIWDILHKIHKKDQT